MFTERVHSRGDRRAATRAAVLASAAKLFRGKGFSATTVRAIAADAGVSTGTVMAVGDKNQLLIATFDAWIAGLQEHDRRRSPETRDEGASGTRDASAGERVRELVRPFIELFARDQELARAYAGVLVSGAYDSAIFTELADGLILEFENALEDAGVAPEHAKAAARVIYRAYLGILFSWSATDSTVSLALDELDAVVAVVARTRGE